PVSAPLIWRGTVGRQEVPREVQPEGAPAADITVLVREPDIQVARRVDDAGIRAHVEAGREPRRQERPVRAELADGVGFEVGGVEMGGGMEAGAGLLEAAAGGEQRIEKRPRIRVVTEQALSRAARARAETDNEIARRKGGGALCGA